MIKMENEAQLIDLLNNGLLQTINEHGPITRGFAHSAAKRISGNIKNWFLQKNDIREKKRIINFGLIQAGVTLFDEYGPVVIMAIAKGYAMVRRPRCMPFVVSFKDIPKKYSWGKPLTSTKT